MQNKYSDGSFRITITGSCDFEDDFYRLRKSPLFSGVDAESVSGLLYGAYRGSGRGKGRDLCRQPV